MTEISLMLKNELYLGITPDNNGAGDRDRTGMASLEGWGSTIELHPQGG